MGVSCAGETDGQIKQQTIKARGVEVLVLRAAEKAEHTIKASRPVQIRETSFKKQGEERQRKSRAIKVVKERDWNEAKDKGVVWRAGRLDRPDD